MMLKNLLSILGFALLLTACTSNENPTSTSTNTPAATTQNIGEPITVDGAVAFDELYGKMKAMNVDSLDVKVTGTVGEVCQKKGCWMTLVPSTPGMEPMRVTFKDYAFFMPFDLSGKKVVVDGFAYTEETPVETLRHYAEDAGQSAEEIAKITQPKKEISFEAKGVIILP